MRVARHRRVCYLLLPRCSREERNRARSIAEMQRSLGRLKDAELAQDWHHYLIYASKIDTVVGEFLELPRIVN